MQSEITKDMWRKIGVFKRELWHNYYISRSVEGEPILLPRASI